jgi:syntaxin VAM3
VEERAQEGAVLREMRGNEALRGEREAALRDVHASVADVNAIFVDLASMVGEQASQVEYVELQLGDAGESVGRAKKELETGVRRRESRKKLFFITLLFIAAVFAVFLVLVLR